MTAERPRRRRKDARPGELIEAALAEFTERGFAGTTVERVAARAGAAKGTVYRYFATKDALFEAVVREVVKPAFQGFQAAAEGWTGSSADLLRRVVSGIYVELVQSPARRAIVRMLIAEGERFPQLVRFYHREVLAGAAETLGGILARGVASGEFRDGPAAREPRLIVAPAMLAVIWRLTFEQVAPLDLEPYAEAHLDLILDGLRARPGPPE